MIWSLEPPVQRGPIQELNSINQLETSFSPLANDHKTIASSSFLNPEGWKQINHLHSGISEIDQLSRDTLPESNKMGSIVGNIGSQETRSLGLPDHFDSMSWSQLLQESVINIDSRGKSIFEHSHGLIPPTGSFTEGYTQNLKDENMSHVPIKIPHQIYMNRLEEGHISSDSPNHIMECLANHNQLSSETRFTNSVPESSYQNIVLRNELDTGPPGCYGDCGYQTNEYKEMCHSPVWIPNQDKRPFRYIADENHASGVTINSCTSELINTYNLFSHDKIPLDGKIHYDQQVGTKHKADTILENLGQYVDHINLPTSFQIQGLHNRETHNDITHYKKSPNHLSGSFNQCTYQAYHSDFPHTNPQRHERVIAGFGSEMPNVTPNYSLSSPSHHLPTLVASTSSPSECEHGQFGKAMSNPFCENFNLPPNWPQVEENQISRNPLGKEGAFPIEKQPHGPDYNVVDKNLEQQDPMSPTTSQNYPFLKRKASQVFTSSLNEAKKNPRKDQDYDKSKSLEFIIMRLLEQNHSRSMRSEGVTRRDIVQTIQHVGIQKLQLYQKLDLQHQKWFNGWKRKLLDLIFPSSYPRDTSSVNETGWTSLIHKVEFGVVMGFLGVLNFIESHITEKPVMLKVFEDGLKFIEQYLDKVYLLATQNLARLTSKFVPLINISSDPLEVILSLLAFTHRRDLRFEVYHNIWSNWKNEKYPSVQDVSFLEFTKLICGITLPHVKLHDKTACNSKVDQSRLQVPQSSQDYSYRKRIVEKGKQCMINFESIFHNKDSYFQMLKDDMLDKFNREQDNLSDYESMHHKKLVINAMKVVKLSVVDGFFGIIKCLHEKHDSHWNLEIILRTGWEFFQHHFSLWKTINLDNLFNKKGLSNVKTQQKLNKELRFSAESFYSVMRSSYTQKISVRFVLQLLRDWAHSLPMDQKDFKGFQMLLKSHDKTSFTMWF
ncbi:uncharacterized protein MELLADRAFT_69117 [Melampsora larici-populina 98AG31]|uniref:Uncharacterized protein n=1 Tax=Melampsora larici-populina (strain 98AG31 / pathotype 3-4-7) TaxID=747676 RepID=F4S9G1_MELLP|nr:uncharacterized protein MELLADRAFT_69117 [Melampsora larici-populina 98AG31]EGF98717.1 hypothetical protein MELLADRAFT_69117 [Melampsora larici-populina 98AG31]